MPPRLAAEGLVERRDREGLVRRKRFELLRDCSHCPLKTACLPIPPPARHCEERLAPRPHPRRAAHSRARRGRDGRSGRIRTLDRRFWRPLLYRTELHSCAVYSVARRGPVGQRLGRVQLNPKPSRSGRANDGRSALQDWMAWQPVPSTIAPFGAGEAAARATQQGTLRPPRGVVNTFATNFSQSLNIPIKFAGEPAGRFAPIAEPLRAPYCAGCAAAAAAWTDRRIPA